MKYVIIDTLFGWMCRGLLLWDLLDWCMAICEIYLLRYAIENLKIGRKFRMKNRKSIEEKKNDKKELSLVIVALLLMFFGIFIFTKSMISICCM